MPAALDTPALDAMVERLDRRLARLAATGDRRERALLVYRTFKVELRRNLREGRFRDPAWAEAVCCRMGELYFEADIAYEQDPARCPEPWTSTFDAVRRRGTNLFQDMLLAMNAHINHDLPLCTFQTMERFGDVEELSRGGRTSLRFRELLRRRYHDFLLINEIAWESIPRIQKVACARLNPLARLVNRATLRFTRPPLERIICEYRDRAWAHTLVLISSTDPRSAAAIRRHLSLFALRAVEGVERLSPNPLRRMGGRAAADPGTGSVRPVVRTLVDHLGHRPTRSIARQALIEYGEEAQPELIRTLVQAPPLPRVRAELYRVFGAHPTPAATGALTAAISRENEVRGVLLGVLARIQPGLRREDVLEPLMAVAREESTDARRLLGLASALGAEERRGSMLDRALREHAHRALCRAESALAAAGRPPPLELPPADALPVRTPPLDALLAAARAIATAVGDSPLEPDPPSRDQAAEGLLRYPDAWIRACSAWWLGLYAADPAGLIERVRDEDHELVKETSLRALERLLPEERLRDVAGQLLRRRTYTPDTPARALAAQILAGEVTMITTMEKVLHLKNVELFQDVLAEDLVTIARVTEEHPFDAGDRLIRKDAPGVATYVIVEGTVEVRGLDGEKLATVGPGGVLGEMSVVSDLPTSADCIAATDGVALRIARQDFHALLQDHPATAIGVMHVLAQRLRAKNRGDLDVAFAAPA